VADGALYRFALGFGDLADPALRSAFRDRQGRQRPGRQIAAVNSRLSISRFPAVAITGVNVHRRPPLATERTTASPSIRA
jgi:hypothetical protein